MCERHDRMKAEIRARQDALNAEAPKTFDARNDIETAYRVAFLAATMRKPGYVLEAVVRDARELLDLSGYTDVRRRQLDRLREEAELQLDVLKYNRDAEETHGGETAGALADLFDRLKPEDPGSGTVQ